MANGAAPKRKRPIDPAPIETPAPIEMRVQLEGKSRSTLRFGSVLIEAGGAEQDEWARNVSAGRAALVRSKKALATPGVQLDLAAGTPKYHVDAKGRLIQIVRGKQQQGKLVRGTFRATDA